MNDLASELFAAVQLALRSVTELGEGLHEHTTAPLRRAAPSWRRRPVKEQSDLAVSRLDDLVVVRRGRHLNANRADGVVIHGVAFRIGLAPDQG